MSRAPQRVVRGAALAATVAVLAGCGSGPQRAGVPARLVRVTESDFRIVAPAHVRAGEVRFLVRNRGPVAHELIVVRHRASRLPFRGDDLTIDEDAVASATAGALEPGAPGAVRSLEVRLRPGRYELFCNMSGHFLGGMHHELVVSR